jgi:biopolymer transport protein ExbB
MGLNNILQSADAVFFAVLFILISMSIVSWYIVFSTSLKIKKQRKFYQNFYQEITKNFTNPSLSWVEEFYFNQKNFSYSKNNFSCIDKLLLTTKNIAPIIDQYISHDSKKEIITLHLTQTLDEIRYWLDRGLTILASIGSCSPFIGLFGTVWGIYHALENIASKGSAGLNVVAGPIAESLVATAIGLFTAIPAVLAYNYFVRANRLLIQNLRHIAEQITVYLSNNHSKNNAK